MDERSLPSLCRKYTELPARSLRRLSRLAEDLDLVAELSQADVFIDVLDRNRTHAWVVAQARPRSVTSLYATSVIGQRALAENEPGVLRCLTTGNPSLGTTGISQEGVPIRQRVMPILDHIDVVGALIMEADISRELQREHEVARLEQTTAELSETLLGLLRNMSLAELIEDGLLIVSPSGEVIYANASAQRLFARHTTGPTGHLLTQLLPDDAREEGGRFRLGDRTISLRSLPHAGTAADAGSALLLRDVTDIRQKEQQLTVKDMMIRETHHRVKNNLQMMASLLRLEMRRSDSHEVTKALNGTITRLHAIASVHETLLTQTGESVALRDVALRIADYLRQAFDLDRRGITISVAGDMLALPLDRATSAALCLNELIHNSLRHGFLPGMGGRVMVHLGEETDRFVVVVRDEGIGFDHVPPDRTSLGLGIVRTLVLDDLKGAFQLQGSPGVTAKIVFPKGAA